MLPGQIGRRLQERRFTDRLHRLESRAGRRQGSCVDLWIGGLEDEGDVDALHLAEAGVLKECLANAGSTQGDHGGLVLHLCCLGEREGRQRPGAGRGLDVAPHRQPDPAAGDQDSVHLGHRIWGRPPDPPKAGHDVERPVIPRHGVHVPDPQVGVRIAIPSDRDEALRRVDTRAPGSAESGELDGETRPAGDVEQPIAGVQAESVVEGDVLAAIRSVR